MARTITRRLDHLQIATLSKCLQGFAQHGDAGEGAVKCVLKHQYGPNILKRDLKPLVIRHDLGGFGSVFTVYDRTIDGRIQLVSATGGLIPKNT